MTAADLPDLGRDSITQAQLVDLVGRLGLDPNLVGELTFRPDSIEVETFDPKTRTVTVRRLPVVMPSFSKIADSPRFPTPPFARVQSENDQESQHPEGRNSTMDNTKDAAPIIQNLPARYVPAQLWYDTRENYLVIFRGGKPVPVTEPVLPGLEVL